MRTPSSRFTLIAVLVASFGLAFAHPAHAAALDPVLSFFAGIAMSVAEMIGRLVLAVLGFTIPLMHYQGFTTSPVVVNGWAIVRDVVNMFFVVVLIVIAMGTIFGHSRFQWKQQVPKLMIFAIVINFSKTLCGIMIDFAQVVMLTFANALKDIAGGNFIQLLGLGKIFSLSEEAASVASTGAFDLFAAAAAAVFMMVWVLAVVVMLMFVLVYRVVMLWILIVLAPLAWFMGGQSVFKSDAYAEWWKNFICYTAIGPVITFFLWLTLAVVGSGVIASTDQGFSSAFTADGGSLTDNSSRNLSEIFELQNLASFVIGMAMLMAGLDAAAKICQGVKKAPGFESVMGMGKAGGFINRFAGGQARKYGSKYGGKALASGWSGTKTLAAGGATAAGLALAGQGINLSPAAQAAAKRDLSKKAWMPDRLAKQFAKSADEQQKEVAEKIKKAAEEEYKDMSADSKVEMLTRYAKNGMPVDPTGKKAALGLLAEAIKDPKMREKLEAAGVLGKLVKEQVPDLKKQLKGTKDYEAIEEFEAGRPDLTGKISSIDDMEKVKKLDKMALTDEAVQRQIRTISKSGYFEDDGHGGKREVDAYEAIANGHLGTTKQTILSEGKAGYYAKLSDANFALVPDEDLAANLTPALLAKRKKLAGVALASRSNASRSRLDANPALRRSVNEQVLGFEFDATGTQIGVDASKVKAAVRNNPLAVKNAKLSDDSTGQLKAAIAEAYESSSALQNLIEEYRASPGGDLERRELDASVIENIFESFDQVEMNAAATHDTALETEIKDRKKKLILQLEKIEGGKTAMMTKLNSRIRGLSVEQGRLSAITGRTTEQQQRLDIVTEDLARMNKRLSRH